MAAAEAVAVKGATEMAAAEDEERMKELAARGARSEAGSQEVAAQVAGGMEAAAEVAAGKAAGEVGVPAKAAKERAHRPPST